MTASSEAFLDSESNRRSVDGARGLGMLLVIMFHTVFGSARLLPAERRAELLAAFPDGLSIAWQALGSEIVFLFSAFLLGLLLLRELETRGAIDVGDFYLRRVARILPLYALALVLYAPFSHADARDTVLNLLFVSRLFGAKTIIPVGWSLEVLMQVYVLLPFVVAGLIKSGRPIAVLLTAIVVCLGARFAALAADPQNYGPLFEVLLGNAASGTQEDLYYLLGYRATPFLLGLLLAYGVSAHQPALTRLFARSSVTLGVMLLSLLLIAGSGFLPLHDRASWLYAVTSHQFWLWFWTLQRFVFAAGLCALMLCIWYGRALWLAPFRWLLTGRLLGLVAHDIYAIYLFHIALLLPAAAIVLRTTSSDGIERIGTLEIASIFALGTALSLAVGRLLTAYVEAPARRWLKSRAARWRGRWVVGRSGRRTRSYPETPESRVE